MQENTNRVESIIRNAQADEPQSVTPAKIYVTHSPSKITFNLDNSALFPKPLTSIVAGGKATQVYVQGLEKALFSEGKGKEDFRMVSDLCRLFALSANTPESVQITSGKLVRSLPLFITTLNTFITENAKTISAIAAMMYDIEDKDN